MDALGWEKVKELFHAALRDRRVLEGASGEVRAEVEALLRAHAEAPLEPACEATGTMVGRYKLLQQLGEGGFGVVWMAEQIEPVRRHVALKILKPGMDTGQVIARFEAERQALALMDHPCIAKVLDAGATASGRPYFVMELVRGIAITQYCDEARLDTRARLDLFVQVCHAVQHAHQKGIIHRDLKPSNLLVALHDGRPLPKIIDFGIAKATDQRLTERTLFTEFRQMIGTPDYMAPEQAEMSGLDIDTRADIYSLGVLLYELLTGTKPFDLRSILQGGYEEILRTIREVDPPRPSNRISTMGESLTPVAASRRTAPRLLGRLLKGDLDWIVMKALEKERGRRYETANALAQDVRRHLADEPVLAGPASALYRARKYARRHRVGATAALLAVTALVAGVAVAFGGYVEAAEQRDLSRASREEAAREALSAEEASAHEAEQRALADRKEKEARTRADQANAVLSLVREMLASADPHAGRDPGLTVRELLDGFDRGLGDRLRDQPEVEATIRLTIGRAYLGLALPDRAERHLKAALDIRSGLSEDDTAFADALSGWASFQHDIGQYAAATETLKRALAIRRRLLDPAATEITDSLGRLSDYASHEALGDEAERLARERLDILRSRGGDPDERLALAMTGLAVMLAANGDGVSAESLSREALSIARRVCGERHPTVASALRRHAEALMDLGDLDGAEALARESARIRREFYGDEHPTVASDMGFLAVILNEKGDRDGAEALMSESLVIARRTLGEDHPRLAVSLRVLGVLYFQGMDEARAEPLLREALAIERRALRPEHPDLASTILALGRVLARRGDPAEGEALIREAIDLETPRGESSRIANFYDTLARLRLARGDPADAEALERKALESCRNSPRFDPSCCAGFLSGLYLALRAQGRGEDAEATLREAVAVGRTVRTSRAADRCLLGTNLTQLASVLYEKRDLAGAEPLVLEALAIYREIQGLAGVRHLRVTLRLLGTVLYAKGDAAGALAAYREVVAVTRRLSDDYLLARSLLDVAFMFLMRGELVDAEATYREALPMLRAGPRGEASERRAAEDGPAATGGRDAELAKALFFFGIVLTTKGDLAEAETVYCEALALYRKAFGDMHGDVAAALHMIGTVLRGRGDFAGAEAAFREGLAIRRKVQGDTHAEVSYELRELGDTLLAKGDVAGAELALGEALEVTRRARGDSHPDAALVLRSLARAATARRDLAAAEASLREAVAIDRKAGASRYLGAGLVDLALLRDGTDPAEAESLRREAVSVYRKSEGDRSCNLAMALVHLAVSLEARGDLAGSDACLSEAVAIRQEALGPDHALTQELAVRIIMRLVARGDHAGAEKACRDALGAARPDAVLAVLGLCLLAQGKHADAEAALRECLAARVKASPDAWTRWNAQSMLGESIAAQGRHAEAEPLLLEAYEKMEPPAAVAFRKGEALDRIVKLYEAWGKPGKAAEWRKRGGAGG